MDMTREQAAKALELRDAIIALFNDSKYKTVFEDAYFRDEAARLALATVDNEMQDEIEQRIVNEKIRAVGHLHVFLNSQIALGNMVQASLDAEEKEKVDAAKVVEYDEITGDSYEVEAS
jgi:epoxyqueuosine reductase QueG